MDAVFYTVDMQDISRSWQETRRQCEGGMAPDDVGGGGDLYLIHRVLADYPQAYAAVREAFRARDAASRPVVLCSQCMGKVDSQDG